MSSLIKASPTWKLLIYLSLKSKNKRLDSSQLAATRLQYSNQPRTLSPVPLYSIGRQLSSGSLVGLISGVIITIFSQAIALLATSVILSYYMLALRLNIKTLDLLSIVPRRWRSKLFSDFRRDKWFFASFICTFILTICVHI
ncbi:hypothetical protein XA68_11082 [Ophiocordyceps unilateralis]|uniref:Uncharacterized protein n=1 Tax=Ophiocordyceps unilateralis TaxID=268505 RepID=A0A2A9P208_OPHUN|nr:hypothetical protein XA68_11082 [Ophiocordyceps unilateralis]